VVKLQEPQRIKNFKKLMRIFDLYIFKNLFLATIFIGLTLTVVIFLTQSLRFLELVIESGASSLSFWLLTFLALPRFFEVIMPLALMSATLFIYNRMTMDSELIAIRAVGFSPLELARPAIMLAIFVTVFLWAMTLWAAPAALSNMQEMRQVIKSQFSNLLFREGVFNQVGQGLTLYIRERSDDGELHGLMIHDAREGQKNPSMVLAKRGVLQIREDGHEVLVYEGSRQEFDPQSRSLNRLNFDRYTIELPESSPVRERWPEPDERTVFELINPDLSNQRDLDSLHDFKVEIHRRIASPLLAIAFTLIGCVSLLQGTTDRRGQTRRIVAAVLAVIVIQGLFLASFNISRQTAWGLPLMHLLVFSPIFACLFLLMRRPEKALQETSQTLRVVS
jgi:lipopolysaccharide export system permease protein